MAQIDLLVRHTEHTSCRVSCVGCSSASVHARRCRGATTAGQQRWWSRTRKGVGGKVAVIQINFMCPVRRTLALFHIMAGRAPVSKPVCQPFSQPYSQHCLVCTGTACAFRDLGAAPFRINSIHFRVMRQFIYYTAVNRDEYEKQAICVSVHSVLTTTHTDTHTRYKNTRLNNVFMFMWRLSLCLSVCLCLWGAQVLV